MDMVDMVDRARRNFLVRNSVGYAGVVTAGLWSRVGAAQNRQSAMNCLASPPAVPRDVGPGEKFSVDGAAQPYPGNTIICPIAESNPALDELCAAYEELRTNTRAGNLAWLPPSSYHSTIFDGATNANRRPGDWPQMLPLNASMDECNRDVADRLQHMSAGIAAPIRMVVDMDEVENIPAGVLLKPVDAAENRRLRKLRDAISLATGIRHANHDDYRFHTSFAYYVRLFSPAAEASYRSSYVKMLHRLNKKLPVIELGSPEYCVFQDMLAYQTQFALKNV
ncbi:hypothetical protein HDE79_002351 [Rhodanobacter sp. MP1X3]|nr:hypothetical protein [Rhodanobacter sp. MP1X3]